MKPTASTSPSASNGLAITVTIRRMSFPSVRLVTDRWLTVGNPQRGRHPRRIR